MKYVVPLSIALLIIGALALYSWWDYSIAERSVREHLRQQQQDGELPGELQGVDIEALNLANYVVQMPNSVMQRQNAARLLVRTWFLWGPLMIGAAVVAGWWRSTC